MIRSRNGFMALGLLVLALGVMAFGASAAQATPEWMVNGANITTNTLLPEVQIKEVELLAGTTERHLVLLTTSGTSKIEILCETAVFNGIKLAANGETTEGDIHFSNCKFFLNGKENKACIPSSPGQAAGLILTNAGHGRLELNSNGVPIILIIPSVENAAKEKVFVTLNLGAGLCPIGEQVEISNTFDVKDCNNKAETEEVEHLLIEDPVTSKLRFGGNPATIDGSVWVRLVGAHLGQKFSGLAG